MTASRKFSFVGIFGAFVLLQPLLLAITNEPAYGQSTASPQASSARLPDSLTNATFNSISTFFSEAGGFFSSDNFTSNEMSIGQLSTELRLRGRTGGAYIGVGPEQNFTYIAALKPEIAFIVDIRRQAVIQHLMYKALFELSSTRGEFISRLFSKPPQTVSDVNATARSLWDIYLPIPNDTAHFVRNLDAIHQQLEQVRGMTLSSDDSIALHYVYSSFYRLGPGISYRGTTAPANFASLTSVTDTSGVERSFLSTEEDYHFVRGMHQRNLIIPVVGDFGGARALHMVANYLREHSATLSAYYTSNVEQYLFRPNDTWRAFYANVALMPMDSASLFIRPTLSGGAGYRSIITVPAGPLPPGWNAPGATSPPATSATAPPPAPLPQSSSLGSISGVVRDSSTGSALVSAAVSIVGSTESAVTGNDGSYVLPNVRPGIYTFQVRRIGYANSAVPDVRVVAGSPTKMDFVIAMQPLRIVSSASVIRNPMGAAGGVVGVMNITLAGGNAVQLCPMMPYLQAHAEGRVQIYSHATTCMR